MRKNFENYSGLVYLNKDWVFPYSEVPKDSNIILYGAGDVGQAYYYQIIMTGYCKIKKWVDHRFRELQNIGLPVEKPELHKEINIDYVVIAVADASTAREINEEIVSCGIFQTKIVWITNKRMLFIPEIDAKFIFPAKCRLDEILKRRCIDTKSNEAVRLYRKIDKMIMDNKLVIPRIVVEMTSVCTLHCEKCNNLMPFYGEPKHCSIEELLEDIKIFLNNVDLVLTMELIGGEPFAYPHLCEVLRFVLFQKKIMEVEITTNGTIIPAEKVLCELRNSKVIVRISDYGIVKKMDKLIDVLIRNSIHYEIKEGLVWIDSGGIEQRMRSHMELKMIYASCFSAYYCKTLFKGKLYACARSASLYDLEICTEQEGYVDIRDENNLKQRIKSFFLEQENVCCNYCDCSEIWRQIPPGRQREIKI